MTGEPRVPRLPPALASIDVIGTDALIWRRLIDLVAQAGGVTHVMASGKDILDGIALSLI